MHIYTKTIKNMTIMKKSRGEKLIKQYKTQSIRKGNSKIISLRQAADLKEIERLEKLSKSGSKSDVYFFLLEVDKKLAAYYNLLILRVVERKFNNDINY